MVEFEDSRLEPDLLLLRVNGAIVMDRDSKGLEWKLQELVAGRERRIIVDLTGVDYVDSVVAGILARFADSLRKSGGGLRTVGANSNVRNMFEITSVAQLVGLHDTVEEAAISLRHG